MKKNKIILFFLTLAFIFFSLPALAQENNASTAPVGFLDGIGLSKCMESGSCSLEDMSFALSSLINLMLGIVGALALLYFFWGGIIWISSFGNAEKVKKGSSMMFNTFIALLIVFTSYLLLQFLINNVLGVRVQYQIKTAECSGASINTVCNLPKNNYVCDGRGNCVTKCDIKNLETATEIWQCTLFQDPEARAEWVGGGDAIPNLCPGGAENICVKVEVLFN